MQNLNSFRLHRSSTDKMLGGVCGGLAESLEVDATLLRLAFVALTVLGAGAAAVIYVAIWALAPVDPAPATPAAEVPVDTPTV
ncbi:PspC domain-containing protein [Pseudonocardia sp. CA-107938]|uniref:PspC domain-containing protein n=1 Tax=Pseudonocardia sp. CA-107938 TaxID=3240021 RepID=UPI003D8F2C5D